MNYIASILFVVHIAYSQSCCYEAECSFEVLSDDHSSGQVGTYFHFRISVVDQLLGHTNWHNVNFQVYNHRKLAVSKVILWRSANGGSVGNAHGRKDDGTASPGDFRTGDRLSIVGIVPFRCNPTPECTFIVLSIDHTSGLVGQYFNFDVDSIDVILGTCEWHGSNYAIYNHRTQEIIDAVFWNTPNGGSVGDGHGREDDGTHKPGDFQIGDAISFVGIPSICS